MKIAGRILVILFSLSYFQGCAVRSSRAVMGGMELNTGKVPSTNLTILIRTMTGRPSAEDQAVINLDKIRGDSKSFMQVFCQNTDGNLKVLLTPALISVGGKDNDHFEYSRGHYSLDFYLGEVDSKNLSPPQDSKRIGLWFLDVGRPRQVLEMDTEAFGTWYIMSVTASKKSDRGWASARHMSCVTRNRNLNE